MFYVLLFSATAKIFSCALLAKGEVSLGGLFFFFLTSFYSLKKSLLFCSIKVAKMEKFKFTYIGSVKIVGLENSPQHTNVASH